MPTGKRLALTTGLISGWLVLVGGIGKVGFAMKSAAAVEQKRDTSAVVPPYVNSAELPSVLLSPIGFVAFEPEARQTVGTLQATPINAAEAIFAPFFDPKISPWRQFEFVEKDRQDGVATALWDCFNVQTSAREFGVRWRGKIDAAGYDRLRAFLTFAPSIRMRGVATVNGRRMELFSNVPGGTAPVEVTSAALGNIGPEITELEFWFTSDGSPVSVSFSWLGLVASDRERLLEISPSRYTPDWPGMLVAADSESGLGRAVMYDVAAIEEMKKKSRDPFFRPWMDLLAEQAAAIESLTPEAEIREFLPCNEHLWRYVRVRDRGRRPLAEDIAIMALAGYLHDRPDWTRMAARMILCAAHTPNWFEGPVGCFPGSTWHHVCFTEDHHVAAIAFAMPFVEKQLTPVGREKVLDAVEKAWNTVDRTCAEPGYRWQMNQGLVGNRGRMLGACLLTAFGRDRSAVIETAYRDHTTIVHNYLNKEGHCFEGPHYYQYSFDAAIELWTAYARYTGKSLGEVIPDRFGKSMKYVEAMMSSTSDLGTVVPVNAASNRLFSSALLALYASQYQSEMAKVYLQRRSQAGKGQAEWRQIGRDAVGVASMLNGLNPATLRGGPSDVPTDAPVVEAEMVESGLGVARLKAGKLLFLAERRSQHGHVHADRGSVLLEWEGQPLLLDPGTTNYSNPAGWLMKQQSWHNTAFVEGLEPLICTNADETHSPLLKQFERRDGKVIFKADMAPLYPTGVRAAERSGSLEEKPDGLTLRIEDRWVLEEPRRLNAVFQSYGVWQLTSDGAICRAGSTEMVLKVRSPQAVKLKIEERKDADMKPFQALIVTAEGAAHHRLESVLEVRRTSHRNGGSGAVANPQEEQQLRKLNQ